MTIDAISILIGLLAGLILMGLIVWFTMPRLMLIKHKCKQDYTKTLALLTDNLTQKKDWRVLKINDYQESTAAFGPLERVCSVNVCNPKYAFEILKNDANRGVTAFMPLAIGIYENKSGDVFVSQLNVGLLGMMFGGIIAQVMKKAGVDLNEIVNGVITQ